MPITIVHDFLQETENGLVLNVYTSRNSDVEFAEELGRLANPLDHRHLYSYIKRHHPNDVINRVRIITGDSDILTLSYMDILADVTPRI